MNLKQLLKSRGWTIQDLAAHLTDKDGRKGVTQSSASQIINGNPTLRKLEEIAAIVGVPLWELLRGEVDDEPAPPTVVCPCCGASLRVSLCPVTEDEQGEGEAPRAGV